MSESAALHPPIARTLGDVVTSRLELRRLRADDLGELAAVFAQPEVWRFPYGRAFTHDETAAFLDVQVRNWADRGFGPWAAVLGDADRIIGYVGLAVPEFLPEILPAVEVGWRLHPESWGHGYATEGAAAALDEAFTTLGLDEVCSLPQAGNPRSVRVAERLDMRLVDNVEIQANGRRGALQACHFKITASEWLSRQSRGDW